LFGDSFGWYPYGMEPWHWEYNPPAFPEKFKALVEKLRQGAGAQSLGLGRRNGAPGNGRPARALLQEPIQTKCAFFGPNNVVVTGADVGSVVAAAAQAERLNWFGAGGRVKTESQNSQFGNLVSYTLGRQSAIFPATLAAAQATAVGG